MNPAAGHQALPAQTRSAAVSVIIPCYRSGATIDRALRSIANQRLLPAEVIVVEDASPDAEATLLILEKLAAEFAELFAMRVIALSENQGAAAARNQGWAAAQQPYIAFLDADDAWHPQKLQIQYHWMLNHPAVALSGHSCITTSPAEYADLTQSAPSAAMEAQQISFKALLFSNRFSTPAVMLKKNLKHRFKPSQRHSEDYLLWLQICGDHYPCYRLNLPLTYLFKQAYGDGGLSGDLWKMQNGEISAYRQLRQDRLLSNAAFWGIAIFSYLKFLRRLVVAKTRPRR